MRVPTRQNSLIEVEDLSSFVKRIGSKKLYHRDPDVDPPTTAFQRFCYTLYQIRNWFLEANTFLAFKAAVGTILLALPVYLPQSAAWYMAQHGQWAMIILVMWMFPMAGMFFYTVIMRVLGTCAGGVLAIVVWEIAQGNPYGLAVVTFVVSTLFYYCLLYKAPLRVLAMMTLITMIMVICYEYQFVHDATGDDPVWTLSGKRMLLVVIGVGAAAILSMIPYPVNGRVELRKRLAETLRDIGRMYSLLTSQFIVPAHINKLSSEQIKSVRHLALDLQRQVADERTFLKLAIFEPPLRGTFPSKTYAEIVNSVENMVDLAYDMAFALKDIDPVWREQVALSGTKARQDYYASVLTTIKLVSSTMAAKMSLPPYMVSPQESLDRYTQALYEKFHITGDHVSNPAYPSYCAYLISSTAFVDELTHVLASVEDLVGIEDPVEWLKIHL
ncbi:hypothetical protein BJV82DRAFT_520831 [Fennellomyces sp. T-0311]|nr:hypothetical protein BJV82DRAFT_520831 [Fennellomyces sp. T-0311]